ncbi:MAG: sulfite exporter TauE/SafE family protein [Bacteroidota bacterium]|nr:sulfite exporter TauE/SafE family protein [Bacteroidota bacterium]
MEFDFITNIDIFSWQGILLLIVAGFFVGIINTIAGSGTVITYSLFMLMGLPAGAANGTIRLGVIMQTLAASLNFKRKKILEIKNGLIIAVPTIAGTILGAFIAIQINEDIFEKIIGGVMIIMLALIFYKPERWIKGKESLRKNRKPYLQAIIFFAIGIYGGFIHIGVGIFLLAGLVLFAGYDLLKANALKVFIVFLYSPFALAVFILNDQVHYGMGLVSAIGNLAGGLVASGFAMEWGAKFIRWFLIIVIILFAAKLMGLFELI